MIFEKKNDFSNSELSSYDTCFDKKIKNKKIICDDFYEINVLLRQLIFFKYLQ